MRSSSLVACPICQLAYEDPQLRFCSRCGSDMRAAPSAEGADAWLGKVIDGRYRVQARVGSGGMGAVYQIEHVRMGKVAAMKVLHRDLASDEEAVRRFRREAEAVSRLNHPNIVQTFDFGVWDGMLYLVMEFVRGEDLGAILRRHGALSVARALPLVSEICSALDEAHHLGVVHRDLKPENVVVMRRRDGEHVKVLDFGLAKLRERSDRGERSSTSIAPFVPGRAMETSPDITGAGNLIGTPYYMSPEQVRADGVDHRTDIYSVGATLYRVVTGRYPFEGDTAVSVLTKHLTDELIPPSRRAPERGLPPEVDRIVMRAMARQPGDRYFAAAQMRDEIESALGLIAGRRASAGARPSRSALPPVGHDELSAADPVAVEAHSGVEMLAVDGLSMDGSDELDPLRREDLDEFEGVRRTRRRLASFLVTPLLLLGLGLAAWASFRFLRPRPVSSEIEPNDTPAGASLLPRRKPVSGRVGPPQASGEPDFDYFRVPAGTGRRAVTATASAVPEVDLVLELYDDQGQRLAKVDGGGKGEPERLGPIGAGPGELYLRLRPVWTAGQPSGPGSPVPYELSVDWPAPRAGRELESNDTPQTANLMDGDGSVSGHLTAVDDQDWYRVFVPSGQAAEVEVEGVDGMDIVVLVGADGRRHDRAGVGEDEELAATADDRGVLLLGIAEQPAKVVKGKKPRPERDEPYILKIKLRPR